MSRPILKKRIIITGGGSGGHVSAATAFIEGLKGRYSQVCNNILYVGGDLAMEGEKGGKSIEQKIIEQTDIPLKIIRVGKLQRQFSIHTIRLLFRTILGIGDAKKTLKEFKPDLIVSTGGFVSVPVALAAWRMKVPIYLHEQTAVVGLSNKIVSRVAKKIFVTFKSSLKHFPKNKTILVGNAIRPDIFKTDGKGKTVDAVKDMIPFKKKFPIIYISGGGQGSHLLNITVRQMLPYLLQKYQVILQTGDNSILKDYEILDKERGKLNKEMRKKFYPVKFVNSKEIGHLFNNIDMFVGRAGANTVYEMGVMQKPSLFIPIPWVTHNEQFRNASILKDLGLAKILPEGELTSERLFLEIEKLNKGIKEMKKNIDSDKIKRLFPKDAIEKMMNSIFKEN